MDRMEKIIQYLVDKYSPSVLISYGSFADGSANAGSDYDALLVYDGRECHDGSVIDGTPLDVFCYPAENFSGDYDPEKYLSVFDGKIIIDTDSIGQSIKNKVRSFIENAPKKDKDELRHEVEWCRKMLIRSGRNDAEGFFRWHWVLVDTLKFILISSADTITDRKSHSAISARPTKTASHSTKPRCANSLPKHSKSG